MPESDSGRQATICTFQGSQRLLLQRELAQGNRAVLEFLTNVETLGTHHGLSGTFTPLTGYFKYAPATRISRQAFFVKLSWPCKWAPLRNIRYVRPLPWNHLRLPRTVPVVQMATNQGNATAVRAPALRLAPTAPKPAYACVRSRRLELWLPSRGRSRTRSCQTIALQSALLPLRLPAFFRIDQSRP